VAAAVIAGAAACQAQAGNAGPAAPPLIHLDRADAAVAEFRDATVQELIADAREAAAQHDARTLHRIRARLVGTLRGQALRQLLATHRQILANLAAADAAHDPRARAHYRAELRALCDAASVTTALGLCGADLAGQGG
jgi:hypothetical protein